MPGSAAGVDVHMLVSDNPAQCSAPPVIFMFVFSLPFRSQMPLAWWIGQLLYVLAPAVQGLCAAVKLQFMSVISPVVSNNNKMLTLARCVQAVVQSIRSRLQPTPQLSRSGL